MNTEKFKTLSKKTKEDYTTLQKSFNSNKTKSYTWRLTQLKQMKKMIVENKVAIKESLTKDLKSCSFVYELGAYTAILTEIDIAIKNLKSWMKNEPLSLPLVQQPGYVHLKKEPYGIVLLISPWNYPIVLTLKPLLAVIAAGNCCMVKPSEITSNSCSLLSKLINKYLDTDCIKCFEGGPEETNDIVLPMKFDYIFYTGNSRVGKIIMTAAAKHLTPVSLELGGKSPCIVTKNSNLVLAAKRITWGKYLNSGQTCIAPDYLFVEESVKDKLVKLLKKTIKDFYTDDPKTSPEYSRMVNTKHTKRVIRLMPKDKSKILFGGDYDLDSKYIGPAIVECDEKDPLMLSEIFGPILPVFTYKEYSKVIDFINKREKPLVINLFSNDSKEIKQMQDLTSSGALLVNETLMHFLTPTIPFGGIGSSGMGAYNGKYGFDLFTHKKPVMYKYTFVDVSMRYHPYSKFDFAILRFLTDPSKVMGNWKYLFLLPIICYIIKLFLN